MKKIRGLVLDVMKPHEPGIIEGLGGSVHSVDQVICGEHMVEETKTPQD